jgi:hypothetical protein
LKRKNAFGTNTYPRKKGRSFWVCSWCLFHYIFYSNELTMILVLILCDWLQRFLWEAWQDLTLIILIIAAAVSLVLGIKTEVWSSLIFSNLITFNLPPIFTLRFLWAFGITKFWSSTLCILFANPSLLFICLFLHGAWFWIFRLFLSFHLELDKFVVYVLLTNQRFILSFTCNR